MRPLEFSGLGAWDFRTDSQPDSQPASQPKHERAWPIEMPLFSVQFRSVFSLKSTSRKYVSTQYMLHISRKLIPQTFPNETNPSQFPETNQEPQQFENRIRTWL